MRRIVYALAVGLAWSLSAAQADDRPLLGPTRDVVVTYHVAGASKLNGASRIKVTYADRNDRVRMDFYAFDNAVLPFGSVIYDKPANHVLSLLPSKQHYYELPATGRANPGLFLSDKMHYERAGRATIAGLACDQWRVTNGTAFDGTACVTADGVVLRATRTKPDQGELQAIAVEYQAAPASTFVPGSNLTLAPNDAKPK